MQGLTAKYLCNINNQMDINFAVLIILEWMGLTLKAVTFFVTPCDVNCHIQSYIINMHSHIIQYQYPQGYNSIPTL